MNISKDLNQTIYKSIDRNRRYPAGTFGRIWSVAKLATIIMGVLTVGSVLYLVTFEFSNALLSVGLASGIFVALCERDRANMLAIDNLNLRIDKTIRAEYLKEQILTPQQIRDSLDK